jgi:uncharacterized protein YlaI
VNHGIKECLSCDSVITIKGTAAAPMKFTDYPIQYYMMYESENAFVNKTRSVSQLVLVIL